jgi:hypothetical protein
MAYYPTSNQFSYPTRPRYHSVTGGTLRLSQPNVHLGPDSPVIPPLLDSKLAPPATPVLSPLPYHSRITAPFSPYVTNLPFPPHQFGTASGVPFQAASVPRYGIYQPHHRRINATNNGPAVAMPFPRPHIAYQDSLLPQGAYGEPLDRHRYRKRHRRYSTPASGV